MVLFGLDSVGGGFLSSALIAYWFFQRYGTSEVHLAWLFFAARVLNVLSHFAAAWIARRIGLLNTMVFMHLPSSIFLMLAPLAPTARIAAALFLARRSSKWTCRPGNRMSWPWYLDRRVRQRYD